MKQKIRDIRIEIWREACRRKGIGAVAQAVARLLAPHMPLSQIIVRRLIESPGGIETVAIGSTERDRSTSFDRAALTGEQIKRLLGWSRRRSAVQVGLHRASRTLGCAIPADAAGGSLIGPLHSTDGTSGILILVAHDGQPFRAQDVQLASELLEPFSVALENDRRLHEMAQLREAAEADRRALLTKLGRADVSTSIIGADTGLQPVLERVARVAASDVPVLIFGETGVGKEVIARAVHTQSQRAAGPFIRVNCGAVPPELIDSQLFGHEKGSFTGATERRKGWFERADGGTLFLDEIGDLPLAAQIRLLRVLQDGSLERVGGQQPVHVDVRVIGATHRDLPSMVGRGAFREDLWYRLAVFPITIAPLRERLGDIGPLARHLAEKAATRFGLPLIMPNAQDVEILAGYSWPGNVRELAAVIDRAALLGNGRRLEIRTALGAAPSPGRAVEAAPIPAEQDAADESSPVLPEPEPGPERAGTLEAVTRAHIEAALRSSHGRVEGPFGAAARLAVNPNTLRSRMRRLGIDWRQTRKQS